VRRAFSRFSRTSLPAAWSSLSLMKRSDQKSISLVRRSWTAARVLSTCAMRPLGDLAEVLGHQRGGGERECALLLVRRDPGSREQSAKERAVARERSRSRCGAQPAKVALPSGATRTNCRRFEMTCPSPDLISWVSRNSRWAGRPRPRDRPGSCPAAAVGVLLQQHVADGEHERVAGMHHARAKGEPGLSTGRTASLVKQTRS
jgi:hypothetical protein